MNYKEFEHKLNFDHIENVWTVKEMADPVRTDVFMDSTLVASILSEGQVTFWKCDQKAPNSAKIEIIDFAKNNIDQGKNSIKKAKGIKDIDSSLPKDRFIVIRDEDDQIVCAITISNSGYTEMALSKGYKISSNLEESNK